MILKTIAKMAQMKQIACLTLVQVLNSGELGPPARVHFVSFLIGDF